MYDGLNVGKRNVTLNLKQPDAVELVTRLVVEWADAVAENFAPQAMKGFGLDYDTLAAIKPDLVMVSACLNGQTGPHKDYPGFGGQGSALAGYNVLTGWPDREPVGPYGTITDSLAPRYVAAALAAGSALPPPHRPRRVPRRRRRSSRRSGRSSPWLLDYEVDGVHPPARRQRPPRRGAARRVPVRRRGRRRRPLGRDRVLDRRRSSRRGSRRRSPGDATSRRWTPRRAPAPRSPSSCRPPASRRCRSRTSATCTTTRSSRTAATSSRTPTRSSAPGLYERNGFRLRRARAATTRPARRSARTTTGCSRDVLGLRRRRDRGIAGAGAVE